LRRIGSIVAVTIFWAIGLWMMFGAGFGSSWFSHEIAEVGLISVLGEFDSLVLGCCLLGGVTLLSAGQYFRTRRDLLVLILGGAAFGIGYYVGGIVLIH
jgi:hypothetical protein